MEKVRSQQHLRLLRARHQSGEHIANVNAVHAEYVQRLGLNGHIATVLTAVYGSMYFFYLLVFSCVAWIAIQEVLGARAFDPLPFALLLLVGNFVQLFGGPIIQVGQNLSTAHSELRAESDHHIHQQNAADITEIKAILMRHSEMLLQLSGKAGEK